MLDWWSNFSASHFREQSECMIRQYSNFSWELAQQQNVSPLGPGPTAPQGTLAPVGGGTWPAGGPSAQQRGPWVCEGCSRPHSPRAPSR